MLSTRGSTTTSPRPRPAHSAGKQRGAGKQLRRRVTVHFADTATAAGTLPRALRTRMPIREEQASSTGVCLVGKSTSWRNAAHLTSPTPRTTVNQMVRYSVLDRTFSALSDPTRRHILERLARGPATVSELAQPFDITLPGLLKHVRILEEADLVITEKHGRTRQCRLGMEPLDDAAQWIQTYRHHWEGRLDRLGSYLEKHKGARR
jgi:DNA-binding transcriptional ArsR family regulator